MSWSELDIPNPEEEDLYEWTQDQSPIFKFDGLKSLLRNMGFKVDKAEGYKPIDVADVTLEELKNGEIEFTDDGIFVNSDGIKRQIFLYKRSYHLELYGKPRFHIRKCQTITSFMRNGNSIPEYRRANTETVWVRDMDDNNEDKEVSDLPLCKYCLAIAQEGYAGMDTSDFVEILKNAAESMPEEDVEVDIFGYTKDWEMISRAFRDTHNYTCYKCGIEITDPFDQQYIHTHHINLRKTDNRTANLQCLCIRCHSEVDDFHRERFSSGDQKRQLDDFNKKYPPRYNIIVDNDLPF